jgi:hypothetical protein
MAVTFTGSYSVWGDRLVAFGTLTTGADAQSGAAILPGLKNIDFAHVAHKGAQSAGTDAVVNVTWNINKDSAGAAAPGYLQLQSAISGRSYSVFALGR